jgi:hypothetical protein
MKQQPTYAYNPHDENSFPDCAESRGGTLAHTPHVVGAGEASGETASTVSPQFSCFKCLSTVDVVPLHKSAPYLRAKLYLCRDCIRPRPKHPLDERFDCGCAWNENHYVMLNPEVEIGSTLVARPPDPSCPACRGSGKIRDKHTHRGARKDRLIRGDEIGVRGYTRQGSEDPYLAERGWTIKSRRSLRAEQENEELNILAADRPRRPRGRPTNTIHNIEVTKIYLVNVANEVAEEHQWVLKLKGNEYLEATSMLFDVILFRAKSANPRVLAEWLPMGKTQIYERRKQGERMQNLFERVERMETILERLDHRTETMDLKSDLRWAEHYRRALEDEEETFADENA